MATKNKPKPIPASLKNIDLQAVLRRRGMYTQLRINKELKQAALPIAKEIMQQKRVLPSINSHPHQKSRHAQFTDQIVMEYWEKQIHVVEVIEKRFETKVEQFITKMVNGFLGHLESEIATTKSFTQKYKGYFDDNEDDLLTAAQLDFTPLLIDQAVLAGQEAYRLIGIKDVYTPDSLRKKIATNVEKFTKSMMDTDRQKLIQIIVDSLKDGKSVPEIRGIIQADFDEYSKTQSQRITRTEVLRASNQGAVDAYEQSGVVEGKQWLTAGATDECAEYEGQIVTLSGNFYNSESEFEDGDPPLHPNCRCVVLPVLVDEKAYTPPVNKALYERIKELEAEVDKRTKAYREIKDLRTSERADDQAYIKALERLVNE